MPGRLPWPNTLEHPIGHGRELYFWSFIVAVLIFALGAGVSLYEGVTHMRNPEPIANAYINYIVLGLAFLFEGGSWWVALRQYRQAKGSLGFFEAFRRSKDPPSFMVFFEDSAALVGIVLAAAGTFASDQLGLPVFDGIASIAIGVVLAVVAVLLARESKSLLIGERADRALSDSILRVAGEEPSVACANGLISVQLAPDQVLVALSLEFSDDLRTPQIEQAVMQIEQRVRAAHPEVVSLFVKPQNRRAYQAALRKLQGSADPAS